MAANSRKAANDHNIIMVRYPLNAFRSWICVDAFENVVARYSPPYKKRAINGISEMKLKVIVS